MLCNSYVTNCYVPNAPSYFFPTVFLSSVLSLCLSCFPAFFSYSYVFLFLLLQTCPKWRTWRKRTRKTQKKIEKAKADEPHYSATQRPPIRLRCVGTTNNLFSPWIRIRSRMLETLVWTVEERLFQKKNWGGEKVKNTERQVICFFWIPCDYYMRKIYLPIGKG